MLIKTMAVLFVELARGRSRVGHIRFFSLHRVTFSAFPHPGKLNLSYSMKPSLLLLLYLLIVCMVDQTQMY